MKPIAVSTLKEALRKKTFIVMSIVTVLYLIFWSVILYYFQNSSVGIRNAQFKSMASVMLTQTGLQFSSMLLCLITIVLGSGAIASELENGMIHAIISRPLSRAKYVLGKLFGMMILVAAYATALFAAILLIGCAYALNPVLTLSFVQIAKGWVLYLLVPLTVLCLTIFGSVSLKVVPNGLLMIFIYILGNIGGMVEMIGNYINSKAVISSGIFMSLISPFHTLYSTAERVLFPSTGIAGELIRGAGGLTGSGQPASAAMYIYTFLYTIGFLALAIRKFRKIDIN